jgi:hypothetical protein
VAECFVFGGAANDAAQSPSVDITYKKGSGALGHASDGELGVTLLSSGMALSHVTKVGPALVTSNPRNSISDPNARPFSIGAAGHGGRIRCTSAPAPSLILT